MISDAAKSVLIFFDPRSVVFPSRSKMLFNKQRSKDIKHFTTASEIKSYQEHLQKNKPQEMVTQYACNKPPS